MRKLFSANNRCNAECAYCFAKWNGIYSKQPTFGQEIIGEREVIVYPCCDGEFFEQQNYLCITKSIMDKMEKVYISISTKKRIAPYMLAALTDVNKKLIDNNKGFVKLGISLSNKEHIPEIEVGTLSYNERLNMLRNIALTGMPTSVTIKPILPFIPVQEYFSIIDDIAPIVDRVLLGGLYVCPDTDFYRKYIDGKFITEKREVTWLAGTPVWDYIANADQIEQIRKYAIHKGIRPFDSDIELIRSYK